MVFCVCQDLERGEISGPHAALARLMLYRRVGDTTGGIFDTPLYLGLSAEAGNVWSRRSDIDFDSMQLNGSLFLGIDSYLGPIYLAAGICRARDIQISICLLVHHPDKRIIIDQFSLVPESGCRYRGSNHGARAIFSNALVAAAYAGIPMKTFPVVADNASQCVILWQRYAYTKRAILASFRGSDEIVLMMIVQRGSPILCFKTAARV